MVIMPFFSWIPDLKEDRTSPWLIPVKKKLGSGVSLNGSSEKPKNSLYMGFPGPPRPDGNIFGFGYPANIPPNHYRKGYANRAYRRILSAILIPFKRFIK
jgi:hypothetical protein